MGSVYKPISGKANRPFYLDRICVSVYSGDELVYCLGEYPELLSTDMFSKDLIKWLDEECSAKELAEMIEKLIRAKADITKIVSSLLKKAPFISAQEIEKILKVIKESEGSSEFDKRKARGDFFLTKERYSYAIREYEFLLSTLNDEESERVAAVYHNLGVAKSRLFLFEQAADDFLRAYDCDEDPVHYYAYIATLRFTLTDREYVRMIGDDSKMREVTLKLEADIEKAKKDFLESPEYIDFLNKKEESDEAGRYAFCNFLNMKINEKKEEYNKYVY
ncbi:MAG: hypothetical protein J5515_05960 [Lachnospiraceae bacterium]|nr:hypothetical protein [Lachnospiraceae bacterium]